MRTFMKRTTVLAATTALALSALVAIGARGAGASSDYAPKLAFPMKITTPAGTITLHRAPRRIVSLSPTATEMLYAIGAGKQVIAVDKDSNFPRTGLPTTRFDAFMPNVEQLIALRPSLVVVSYNPNNLESQLASAGIPVMEQDAAMTLRDTLMQITWLGDATGHYPKSLAVATSDKAEITKDVAKVPAHHRSLKVYFELDPALYSVTSQTYVGQLLKQLGVTNVADAVASPLDYGYPQLSSEYLIKSNPGMIFLADTICCHQSYKTVKKRPGFALLAAVKYHRVIGLNDDVASRWGPRVSLLMDQLTAAVLHVYKG
jgi:iron complex transport system substrate-binding protein